MEHKTVDALVKVDETGKVFVDTTMHPGTGPGTEHVEASAVYVLENVVVAGEVDVDIVFDEERI